MTEGQDPSRRPDALWLSEYDEVYHHGTIMVPGCAMNLQEKGLGIWMRLAMHSECIL